MDWEDDMNDEDDILYGSSVFGPKQTQDNQFNMDDLEEEQK